MATIKFDRQAKTNKAGDGKTFPKLDDEVEFHVVCSLMDGEVTLDSRSMGKTQVKKVTNEKGAMVVGLKDAFLQMSLGERATVEIPSELAYGQRGAGGKIPPDAELIYDVELLKINGEPK
eukprot:Hpha_TRINITY_DN16750_c0_g1::TRINITY_DN16750_c0_g1_i3::g.79860::m.79860/K09568/FKBP1; FK506-binding protein 1